MQHVSGRDIRPLPRCKYGLRCAGMLRELVLGYDVSWQPLRSIVLNNLNFEDGISVTSYQPKPHSIPETRNPQPEGTMPLSEAACHFPLSWAKWIQSTSFSPYILILRSHPRLGRSSRVFFSSSPQTFVRISLFPHISVFIAPNGTVRLPWLRVFRAFSVVVRQMPGYNSQRRAWPAPQLGHNFYAVSSSLILVWPLWVRIPESFPTKVVNCVILCIVCV